MGPLAGEEEGSSTVTENNRSGSVTGPGIQQNIWIYRVHQWGGGRNSVWPLRASS